MDRILFLEESESDFRLFVDELKRTEIVVTAHRVETESGLIAALADFSPDVVVIGHRVPSGDGFTATKIVQNHAPGIPVIMISRAGDRRTAIEIVKAGIEDLVTSEELSHLAVAISAALRHKRCGEELRKLQQRVLEKNRRRTDFVSLATHELRGSLASIMGFAGILKEEDTQLGPVERRRFAGIIDSESRRLNALVGDILEISRIESDHLEIRRSPFDMNDLVGRTLKAASIPDTISVRYRGSPSPTILCADADRLRYVITVLLNGAVAYGRGEVAVSVACGDGVVTVCIRDNGPGIPNDEIERVFEAFHHLRWGKPVKGTGLELTIARGIIEAHHGKLWARSQQGAGTTFCFELPQNGCAHLKGAER